MNRCVKLGLGTVQWGMPYGIADRNGQPASAVVGDMLRIAKEHGIALLDTAHGYGEAEKVLGGLGVSSKDIRVVTKTLPIKSTSIGEHDVVPVSAAFRESLQRLRCTRVYGLLVHQADNLLIAGSERLWAELQTLKARGLVEKIGVSVYHPQQLEYILERYRIDLVQLPFNLYDRRFAQTGLLRRLKQAGVEVHGRSAFLQGLLLLPPDRLPEYFDGLRSQHARLYRQFDEAGLTPLEACLRFCLDQIDIDRVIVGCKTAEQLVEILGAAKQGEGRLSGFERYSMDDESVINPSNWPH